MSHANRIIVTIDKLVLKGISNTNAHALTSALQKSLHQELTNRGVALTNNSQTIISLANVKPQKLTPSPSSYGLGLNAGRAIYKSIRSGLIISNSKTHQRGGEN